MCGQSKGAVDVWVSGEGKVYVGFSVYDCEVLFIIITVCWYFYKFYMKYNATLVKCEQKQQTEVLFLCWVILWLGIKATVAS